MMDPITNKLVSLDTGARKVAKPDVKAASQSADAQPVEANSTAAQAATIEVSVKKGDGLSAPPFDYAKVIAIKQSIKNGDYKIDYDKLSKSMVDANILSPVTRK